MNPMQLPVAPVDDGDPKVFPSQAEVATATVDSPHGALLVAVTAVGLVRLAFASEDHDRVRASLAEKVGPPTLDGGPTVDEVARQLQQYFAGQRRAFDLPLDLRLVSGFRRTVISHLATIPHGSTRTYAQVAAEVGHPTAVRAVGGACAHNPVPVVLPCHRVIRSDGTMGQYLGGTETKAALLALEAGG